MASDTLWLKFWSQVDVTRLIQFIFILRWSWSMKVVCPVSGEYGFFGIFGYSSSSSGSFIVLEMTLVKNNKWEVSEEYKFIFFNCNETRLKFH